MEQEQQQTAAEDNAANNFWCGVLLEEPGAVQHNQDLPVSQPPYHTTFGSHEQRQQQQQQQPGQVTAVVPPLASHLQANASPEWPESQVQFQMPRSSNDSADPSVQSVEPQLQQEPGGWDTVPQHEDIAWLDLGPGLPVSHVPPQAKHNASKDDFALSPRPDDSKRNSASDKRRPHSHDGARLTGGPRPARTEQERLERRMAKNRATAAASRQRRKALHADLVSRTSELEGENTRLMDMVLSKDAEIAQLRDQIHAADPS